MRWKTLSALVFALTILAVGLMGLLSGTFAPIWAGVPKSLPHRESLAYLSTFVALACGAGMLAKRTAPAASLLLLVFLSAWTLLFKVPFILRNPLVEVSYQSCGENAVLIAAMWICHAGFVRRGSLLASDLGVRIAHLLYGLALVAFGFSHFAYLGLTAPLIPKWLHWPVFWAYFTGAAYIVSGLAMIVGIAVRTAAVASAAQITLITLIVWGPMVLAGQFNSSNWQEPVVSWALTTAAWVVASSADSYPWLKPLGFGAAARRRRKRA